MPSAPNSPGEPLEPASIPLVPLGPHHRADRFEADEALTVKTNRVFSTVKPQASRKFPGSFLFDELLTARAASYLLILSLLDLLMTYTLLRLGIGAYEANPFANWWFLRWNIAGMSFFKFGVIGCVVVLCETVERRRPRVGQAVLWLGCAAALFVLVKGFRILANHTAWLPF